MSDDGNVRLPKRESMRILDEMRPKMVALLKEGHERKEVNTIMAKWLGEQGNILSPYAEYVVEHIVIEPTEIKLRLKYGDDFVEAWVKAMNEIKKN